MPKNAWSSGMTVGLRLYRGGFRPHVEFSDDKCRGLFRVIVIDNAYYSYIY